jgi:hypothetical protein
MPSPDKLLSSPTGWLQSGPVSETEDDFEFDFFDEPDEETVTQRRRAVRMPTRSSKGSRPPRGPARPPASLTPILRLVGLIAAAILVVVLVVFWIQGCQSDAKTKAYKDYIAKTTAIAKASNSIGGNLRTLLVTPGIKEAELETRLKGLAAQQQQDVNRASDQLDPPGRLRDANQRLVQALQLRVSGLQGLADAFHSTAGSKDAQRAGTLLATQATRLTAGDVVWDDFFRTPATEILDREGVHGVTVPQSQIVTNPDLVTTATFAALFKRLHGATAGGQTSGGLHGTGLVSTTAQPQGLVLSETSDNKVIATTQLKFEVVVKDTGNSIETNIPVTLTIQKQGAPIKQTQTIDVINPGETKTVVFSNIDTTGVFGVRTTLKVDVQPVKNEARIDNNSAQYPVIFSLSP